MKVIDNFLERNQFQLLYATMMGNNVPWYYNNDSVYGMSLNEKSIPQFIHRFYKEGVSYKLFDIIEPCISKLKVKELIKIKANLLMKTLFNRNTGWHIDIDPPYKKEQKTAILYINDNNGYTRVKGYGKVKSVANRMVIFDPHIQHAGYTCTDEKMRVVVNFNYV